VNASLPPGGQHCLRQARGGPRSGGRRKRDYETCTNYEYRILLQHSPEGANARPELCELVRPYRWYDLQAKNRKRDIAFDFWLEYSLE